MIAGRYTRDREIGRGGMGAVWLGRDEVLGRPVAIKGVGVAPGGSIPDLARAEREAKIAASLNHPHIVGVFDLVVEDEQQWLIMEYVEGSTLSELVRDRGPLSADEAAPIIAQAASALAAAHAGGIVHRDVKPSNILVREDGHVKLTDFGIARNQTDAALTQTGLVTGSPAYLAPEVASGHQATPASDVWSLGATLFHALAGHPPYDASNNVLGALYQIVHEPPPRIDDAGRLAPLLEATMTRTPEDRWTMVEIGRFLEPGDAHDDEPPLPPYVAQDPTSTETLHLVPGMTGATAVPASGPASSGSAAPVAVSAAPASAAPDPAAPVPPNPGAASGSRRSDPERRRAVLPMAIAALVAILVVAIAVLALQDDPQDNLASDPTSDPSTPAAEETVEPEEPESSKPTEPAAPTRRELESFVDSYLGTASSNPDRGFELLTPAYQRQSPDYEQFWGNVSNPRLLDFSADTSTLVVDYTYQYQLAGQGRIVEDVQLQLVATDDGFLIAGAL